MTGNQESTYWKSNPRWYFINADGNYQLTDDAPERARRSFEYANMPRSERKKITPDGKIKR